MTTLAEIDPAAARSRGDRQRRRQTPCARTMAGGIGREGVSIFYRDHLAGKFFPPALLRTAEP
jgi:hypothetical protein